MHPKGEVWPDRWKVSGWLTIVTSIKLRFIRSAWFLLKTAMLLRASLILKWRGQVLTRNPANLPAQYGVLIGSLVLNGGQRKMSREVLLKWRPMCHIRPPQQCYVAPEHPTNVAYSISSKQRWAWCSCLVLFVYICSLVYPANKYLHGGL